LNWSEQVCVYPMQNREVLRRDPIEKGIVCGVERLYLLRLERCTDSPTGPNSAAPGLSRKRDVFVEHEHRAKSEVFLRPLWNEGYITRQVTSGPFRIEL
jgi:hypothetical protein